MNAVELKRAEILHYEGVLDRYGMGRWRDMGRRRLTELKEELAVLEQQNEDRPEWQSEIS